MNPVFYFIILHLVPFFGRKFSVPYLQATLHNLPLTLLLGFSLDMIQVPFFFLVYGLAAKGVAKVRQKRLAKYGKKLMGKSKKGITNKMLRWAKSFGILGIPLLAAMPFFGCGMYTATLLSFVLKINKKIAYILLALGCIAGILLLIGATEGIITLR